jgi:hypothetical protein
VVAALTLATAIGWLGSLRLLLPRLTFGRFWLALAVVGGLALAALLLAGRADRWWRLPPAMPLLVIAALAASWALQRWRDPADLTVLGRPGWTLVWLAVGLALVTVFKNGLTTPQYHGRFLFATLGPLSLLAIAGWYGLLPARAANRLPVVVVALMVVINVYYWIARIIPVYYQPGLG